MRETAIQWCDYSSNPIKADCIKGDEMLPASAKARRGWFCTKVSAGCANCYSARINRVYGNGLAYTKDNESRVRFVMDEKELRSILTTKARAGSRVFIGDMIDLFHPMISFAMLDQVFAAMNLRPDLIFMALTKRPARALEYILKRFGEFAPGQHPIISAGRELARGHGLKMMNTAAGCLWPLGNLQLGVTAEDQSTADERIPILLQVPAAVRFVSYEPALGPVDFSPWLNRKSAIENRQSLDGIIAGGESGPKSRPAHPDWFRKVRDDCAAAGVPFFFKQWGEWLPHDQDGDYATGHGTVRACPAGNGRPCQPGLWRKVGKKVAGRLLDGRTHDDLPGGKA